LSAVSAGSVCEKQFTVQEGFLLYHDARSTNFQAKSSIMSSPTKSLAAIILCLLFASGCGQKGPLYLPGNPSEIRTEVPRQDQSQQVEDEDEKEETGTR
jgi:predicted small lipoprotein YifL